MTPVSVVVDALRGGLIGMAELVPGVSGGTLALVTGVYVRVLNSADHVIRALRLLVTGPDRIRNAAGELRRAEWGLLVPLLLGMVTVVFVMAGVMEGFVTGQPELARGLFLGMVAASVAVPLLAVDPSTLRSGASKALAAAISVMAAVVAFLLTSQGGGATISAPPLWMVFGAAAIAICALVLPGVSGSFFLLVMGLYAPTLAAVDQRDLGYLAVFAAGAFTGLSLFVKGLHWLLHHHHTWTMAAMSGLMFGSLRALWPWQSDAGDVLGPQANWPVVLGLALAGAVAVVALVIVDRVLTRADTVEAAAP